MSETSIAKTVYWQPLHDMLDPARSKTQTLAGFDEEFVDLADYILRIESP
ncbi:MAG: nuclear transport factor 2 family protein, partial [Alteromonas sp.]|nr:nuclear transport factor 2 family protein [Alteromonas sp.]